MIGVERVILPRKCLNHHLTKPVSRKAQSVIKFEKQTVVGIEKKISAGKIQMHCQLTPPSLKHDQSISVPFVVCPSCFKYIVIPFNL